jgi:DNA polymerase-3 subunit beta
MHIHLARKELAKALDFIKSVVDARVSIPILSNTRLEATGGRLTLSATDLDIEAKTSIEADVKTPGEITVPARTLADIIRKLAADQVTFEVKPGEGRMNLRSGRAKFHLPTLPPEDWPTLEREDMSHAFTLTAHAIARALKKTTFAISNEETRYYLNGVFMHVAQVNGADMLRLVTTDGHRLARLEMPAPHGAPGMPGVIIPTKTCAELARMAEAALKDNKDTTPEIAIEVNERKIAFRCGDSVLLSKLIDGNFPDYTRVIPAQNDKIAVISRDAVTPAVERVATIASERGRAVKLTIESDKLTLSVSSPDTGDASEEVEIDYDAYPVEIGFNHKYLVDGLNALDGDSARIELADGSSPTLLRTAPDADLLIVLMPMRF